MIYGHYPPPRRRDSGAASPARMDCNRRQTELAALVEQAKAASMAPNTRKTYASAWANWVRWAQENGACCSPAEPGDLQAWMAFLYAEGKKPGTIRT